MDDSRSCSTPSDPLLLAPPFFPSPNVTPPNTPGNEVFPFDEPSSVLASRIIRAHDNPSPPPVSPSSKVTFNNDAKLVDVSEPTTPCYLTTPLPGHVVSLLTTPHSPSMFCNFPSNRSSIQQQGDLIIFDVDDEPTTITSSVSGSTTVRNTCETSEVVKDSDREADGPFILHSNTEEADPPWSSDQSTLVLRSSRDSTATYQLLPTIASEERHVQTNSSIETMPPMSSDRIRLRRKSAKTGDIVEPQGYQETSGPEQNNNTSNAGPLPHHRLSSLSPASSHVLNQLVNASRDDTSHDSKASFSAEFTFTSMQPVDLQKTPSKNSIYTPTPQPDQSPSRTAQVRTPARRILVGEATPSRSKPFNTLPSVAPSNYAFNPHLPRTPIRCTPLSDSPARGTTNPDKAGPLRISSPQRQLLDRSPSKNLPSGQFRTPARRIMREEAAASGSKRSNIFPQIVTSNNVLNLGVARNSTFYVNSSDSPARRVVINNSVTAEPKHTKHDIMLLHSPTRRTVVRSQSEEPPTTKTIVMSRSNSVEPRPHPEGLTFSKPTDLRAPRPKLPFPLIPEAIPEEPVIENRPGAPSVPVSVLKQPTSKIPRIGAKPYARPATATRSVINKVPDRVRCAIPPRQAPTLSSSQSVRKNHTPDERSIQEMVSTHPTANSFAPASKRIRASDDTLIAMKVSTIPPSTTSVMHKATPQVLNATTTDMTQDKLNSRQSPPVTVGDSSEQPSLDAITEEKYPNETPALNPRPAETLDPNATKSRRTSRSRKMVTPAKTISTSSQSRRRVNTSTSDTDVFSSMSAVALKALTNSNTIRNQQYIATKIETEVVRMSGCRPTSPTVKVKTVVQRTQDERSRERRERAQRRAQRNEEAVRNGYVDTQQQPESPTLVALHLNIDCDSKDPGKCKRHRRGAGDDEDYQSPELQSKRRKVTNELEHSEPRNSRRVKWDHGLYTEVRLDEIQLGARLLHKHPTFKGCLAPTSKKTAQLDTMGNLLTSLPVEDLIEECVIVKKYVYDDDEEPPQPPPVAIGTRSKVKKNKS